MSRAPPPAPLDLPVPSSPFSTPPPTFLSPALSPPTPIDRSDTPPPPLHSLASKFANIINRTSTTPVFGSYPTALSPQTSNAHGRSQSLGYFFSGSLMPKKEVVEPELDFGPSLSGDEIERLAREERDWSKREAERLMRLEEDTQLKKERVASGQRSPGRSTSSRSGSTPNERLGMNSFQYPSSNPQPTAPSARAQTPLFPMPTTASPYLISSPSDPSALDVSATLSLLAKRFEKLELWSVSHVKALEDKVGRFEGRLTNLEQTERRDVGRLGHELENLRHAMRDGFQELDDRLKPSASFFNSPPALPTPAPPLQRTPSGRSRPLPIPTPHASPPSRPLTPPTVQPSSPPTILTLPPPSSTLDEQPRSTSPVPPRKRYTAALRDRPVSMLSAPRSTPLPSAPFEKGRSGSVDPSWAMEEPVELSVGKRRAKSVDLRGERAIKASNGARARVGDIVNAWDKGRVH